MDLKDYLPPIQPDKTKNIYILSLTLVNIDTNEEMLLFQRPESRCHFTQEIKTDDHIIYLRVDWTDIRNSDPTLDAEVYSNVSGKRGEKLRYGPWHHTERKYDNDSNSIIYLFKFGNMQLRLMSKMSVAMSVGFDAILVKENENEKEA